ncbi:uncharacterized protein LOC142325714 [Lycorma delicatula]|uniref:uncharacterized protein LOC142325714 n=1 Tax=Lycorma delicatula TaxID=130591 RepID=UPI003F50DB1A
MANTVGDAIIRNVSNRAALSFKERAEGVIVTELESTIIVTAYVSPNITIADYDRFLDSNYRILSRQSKKFVLLGDFNCKTKSLLVAKFRWFAGCSRSNRRGELIEELMESLGGRCLNDGTPTYEARGHYSVLDLVTADNRWSMDQLELTVMDNDISSDHLPLHLMIKEGNDFVVERPFVTRPTARQVDKIVDKVAQMLRNMIELTPDTLTSVIQQEMDKELRATGGRRQVYWWSNEIARLRDNLQQARRRKQRLRIRGGAEFDTAAKLYI